MRASIADLKVDTTKPLDSATKKIIQQQIEQEFSRQTTLFDSKIHEEKRKILEHYKKQVGFDKLLGNFAKKEQELKLAHRAIEETGLDSNGHVGTYYDSDKSQRRKDSIDRLNDLIQNISDQKQENVKSKIITRLWLASTLGEAVVIVNEVMGNNIIPTLQVSQLTHDKS